MTRTRNKPTNQKRKKEALRNTQRKHSCFVASVILFVIFVLLEKQNKNEPRETNTKIRTQKTQTLNT